MLGIVFGLAIIRISSTPFELANTAGSMKIAAPAVLTQRPAKMLTAPSERWREFL
jgi:hypothetical protein